jgi:hypothetical protein
MRNMDKPVFIRSESVRSVNERINHVVEEEDQASGSDMSSHFAPGERVPPRLVTAF